MNYDKNLMNNEKVDLSITPKRDVVFKLLFGKSESKSFLKNFLESILEIEIKDLEVDLGTELLPEFHDGKKSQVDVRTILSDGTEVNIEMQADESGYSDERCLLYWSKLYSNKIKGGTDYAKLKKTICIWIVNGNIFNDFKEYESKWEIYNLKYPEIKRFKNLEFHFFELPKLAECDKMNLTDKEMWLWFIENTNREMVEMACVSNKEIARARKQLRKIQSNDELRTILMYEELSEYDRIYRENRMKERATEEGMAQGMEKGMAEGMEKGSERSKIEIAKRMLKKNMDVSIISEVTGLSCDEIEKLK